MDLEGKVAVITGGKRIGQVVARELAARGMDLVLSYRGSKDEAEQTAADVVAAGRRATTVAADVSKPADCTAIVEHAVATFGRVEVLINMASIYRSTPLSKVTVEYWDTDLNVNLRSAFLCAQAAIPHMRRAGGRAHRQFRGLAGPERPSALSGFHALLRGQDRRRGITEALALEVASDNILVNAIAPGPIVAPPDMVTTRSPKSRKQPLWGDGAESSRSPRR